MVSTATCPVNGRSTPSVTSAVAGPTASPDLPPRLYRRPSNPFRSRERDREAVTLGQTSKGPFGRRRAG